MIDRLTSIPDRVKVGDERVMYEQPHWLAWSADRSDVTLQILPFDGPNIGCGRLSAPPRLMLDCGPAPRDAASAGQPPNGRYLAARKGARRLRIASRTITGAALGPGRSGEVIPKTTESHWSGGQREP